MPICVLLDGKTAAECKTVVEERGAKISPSFVSAKPKIHTKCTFNPELCYLNSHSALNNLCRVPLKYDQLI